MRPLRILIANDFQPWTHQLKTILSKEPLYEVVCSVSDGLSALKKVDELKPDLVLADIGIPTISGIDLARSLQRVQPRPHVLFVSAETAPSTVRAALKAGGKGYVLKSHAAVDLLKAVETVRKGEQFLSEPLRTP